MNEILTQEVPVSKSTELYVKYADSILKKYMAKSVKDLFIYII